MPEHPNVVVLHNAHPTFAAKDLAAGWSSFAPAAVLSAAAGRCPVIRRGTRS